MTDPDTKLSCGRCGAIHTRFQFLNARGCPTCQGHRTQEFGAYNGISAKAKRHAREKREEGRVRG